MLRRAIDRRRRGARGRRAYEAFRAEVEPRLAPRAHRFAAVPQPLAGADPRPVAVAIDVEGGGDVARTRASLESQTRAPAAVVEARGPDTLSATRAEWVAVVAAGDVLAPGALEALGRAAALPGPAAALPALITCDEDRLDRRGRRVDPVCRPGPSPDLMLTRDPAGALLVAAREPALAVRPAAGRTGWRHDLALALAGPDAAGHAHVPSILCHAAAPRAGPARPPVTRPVRGEPSVEVVVCFRDRPELLERCARSVLEGTAYERLALRLVDNGSAEPATASLLDGLAHDPRVTVDRDDRAFHFSALNNAAAARSDADVLVLLNNDAEVQGAGWVEGLLGEAQREEVGAVAPLLLHGDGRVQHAGAAIGIHGYAGHPFAGLRPDEATPFGTATDGPRNWLAVTAACLMVERDKFARVGGFDEGFAIGGGDVDLCLRLLAAGHRSLCVPGVRLRHDESASRDPLDLPAGDYEMSRRRYGEYLTVGDPFYNPNLTLADTSCQVRRVGEEVG